MNLATLHTREIAHFLLLSLVDVRIVALPLVKMSTINVIIDLYLLERVSEEEDD